MAEKLHSIFSNHFEANIWTLQYNQPSNSIIVELRSQTDLTVQFAVCNLNSNNVTILDIKQVDWWTSLDFYDGNVLYLKKYDSDSNPVIKEVIEYKISDRSLNFINPENYNIKTQNENLSPSLYPSGNDYYQLLVQFIEDLGNMVANKAGMEYLDYNGNVYLSYYTGDEKMANYLLVVDKNRDILLHECLDENLSGIGQDTFTIANNKLIFVKQKQELVTYQINNNA